MVEQRIENPCVTGSIPVLGTTKDIMSIDWSVNFLVSSILGSLGFLVISVILLLINSLYAKFWKTVELFSFPKMSEGTFVEPEIKAPLDK